MGGATVYKKHIPERLVHWFIDCEMKEARKVNLALEYIVVKEMVDFPQFYELYMRFRK